mmetsp:Transcript_13649/g.53833  ORF Transcript_13649/g.53833 Transcript_13649/m.53833 type:complete len:287 (-) Transcript_13649:67-927(-)
MNYVLLLRIVCFLHFLHLLHPLVSVVVHEVPSRVKFKTQCALAKLYAAIATDADTCTFNDRIIPFCGITTHASSTPRTSASMPSRSRPSTRAVFLGNRYSFTSTAPRVCSNPTSAYPSRRNLRRYDTKPRTGTSLIGSQRSAVTLTAVKSLCETVCAASAMTSASAPSTSHVLASPARLGILSTSDATTTRPGGRSGGRLSSVSSTSAAVTPRDASGSPVRSTRFAIAASASAIGSVEPPINPVDVNPVDLSTFFCSDNALVPPAFEPAAFVSGASKEVSENPSTR